METEREIVSLDEVEAAAGATPSVNSAVADGEPPAAATASAAAEPAAARSGGFLAPLRIANFRRLFAGQTVSRLGDQFYFIAIPWLVLRVADSPVALSLVTGVSAAGLGAFTLVGGVLADRFGPRLLMLGADIARLLTITALAVLALVATPPLWSLILISALLGIAGGLFYPASSAMTPYLVPSEDLQAANSFEQLTMQLANFLGPGVAGVVLGATRLAFGFVVDAASFVVSVGSLLLIRTPRETARTAAAAASPAADAAPVPTPATGGLGEAFRFLFSTRFLLTLAVLSLAGNLALTGLFEVGIPLLLKHWVGLANGPQALGIVVSGFGLGSVLGAASAALAARARHKPVLAVLLIVPMIGAMIWAPFAGGPTPMALAFGVGGLFLTISNVLFMTVIQRFIPMEMMGRMMSITMLGSFVGTPLSIAIYGAAATVVPDTAWLFFAGSLVMTLTVLAALVQKVVWETA